MKKTIALMAAVSAIVFSANANAEYTPYVGVDYGYTNVSSHPLQFNSGSINVGTMYNEYFGTEAFYQMTTDDKNRGTKTSFDAYGLDLYGYLPLGCDQTVALLGTVGIANYDAKVRGNAHADENGLGYRAGIGAQYSIDENIAVRAIGRYISFDKLGGLDNATEFTLGARYSF